MANEEKFKTPRSMEEIQRDYAQSCARLGELHYRAKSLAKDIGVLEELVENINFEALAAQRTLEEAAAKAKAAAMEEADAKAKAAAMIVGHGGTVLADSAAVAAVQAGAKNG